MSTPGRIRPERTAAFRRKKIGLATALLHGPRLLVLDEPFEAVDPVPAVALKSILVRFVASGGSVVLSSHVMALVEQLCDTVAIVAKGQVVAAGPLQEVRGTDTLERTFVRLVGGDVQAAKEAVVASILIRMKLAIMSTGRAQAAGGTAGSARATKIEMSKRDKTIGGLCWVFGSLLVFPQGSLPAVFIATGTDVKVWFLAMYLPPLWGPPLALTSILAGVLLCARAIMITSRARATG